MKRFDACFDCPCKVVLIIIQKNGFSGYQVVRLKYVLVNFNIRFAHFQQMRIVCLMKIMIDGRHARELLYLVIETLQVNVVGVAQQENVELGFKLLQKLYPGYGDIQQHGVPGVVQFGISYCYLQGFAQMIAKSRIVDHPFLEVMKKCAVMDNAFDRLNRNSAQRGKRLVRFIH